MNSGIDMRTPEQRAKKRAFIRKVIVVCGLLASILVYGQYQLLGGGNPLKFKAGPGIFFVLIDLNALLLLLMLYLVLRQLTELFFERQHHRFGYTLRRKFVIAFGAISFLPTLLLFILAFGSISVSMNYWFNAKVEESLQSSAAMIQSFLDDSKKQAEFTAAQLAFALEEGLIAPDDSAALNKFLGFLVAMGDNSGAPDNIRLLNASGQELLSLRSPRLLPAMLQPVATGALHQAAETGTAEVYSVSSTLGKLVQAVAPVHLKKYPQQTWYLSVSFLIPTSRLNEMRDIQTGANDYWHQVIVKAPMKLSFILLLVLVTLLIFFGSIWLGIYVARTLTTPINELALATRRIAEGDLAIQIEQKNDDEMGQLVSSFNAMTANLSRSQRELARTHMALEESKEISERRRNYLETILEHVPAGVIALDETGLITTVNRFAVDLLAINPRDYVGKDYRDALQRQHAQAVDSFVRELVESGKEVVERHLRMTIRRGKVLSLQVNVARMRDENGQPGGFVIVFDNLTKLEQAQRLAAWQEVARRIAHEIKNPLTPIQLSAQRLRKRYQPMLTSGQDVFDQCIGTIITQVDELRKMVSEFSEFARMPTLKKAEGNLAALVEGVTALYREAHQRISFSCTIEGDIPVFAFDEVQIKRMLINLLDNAVGALDNGGTITTALAYDAERAGVHLTVTDNGVGIPDEIKPRVFEPYFSTCKIGTGLGLAICQTIVSEHGGSIRITDNNPAGTIFSVFLPLA